MLITAAAKETILQFNYPEMRDLKWVVLHSKLLLKQSLALKEATLISQAYHATISQLMVFGMLLELNPALRLANHFTPGITSLLHTMISVLVPVSVLYYVLIY